ncbi:MAG: bifunctional folylpolyglutamate synthase/dihydrofolate synthase [Candidatus Omnitrophica bacterium]|nr:bifunctional folylpolyglutamate synthase/dihydrofolate synthase [Candidatus Omnitrophota bacterium]
MSYQESLKYLDSFIDYERFDTYQYQTSFRLSRVEGLLSRMGDPHKKFKGIHVAGTKGKGSTCAMVASILHGSGYSVGLYTSPHLNSVRERINIDGTDITEEEFSHLVSKWRKLLDDFKTKERDLSYFEVLTALAFSYFDERRVDFAVLETGMGGRLDATNVTEPLVCGITPISYEHTEKLGSTLTAIAREKAAIIKPGAHVVSAPQDQEARDVIRARCDETGASLYEVGRDITFRRESYDSDGQTFTIKGISKIYPILKIPFLGDHQLINGAVAVGIVESLTLSLFAVTEGAIRTGLASTRWPGRLEVVERQPTIVLDGAQNRRSAAALRTAIEKFFDYDRLILVIGVSKDKDIGGILDELLPIADELVITKARWPRAKDPERIKEAIPDGFNGRISLTLSAGEALSLAKGSAKKRDLILVTGSLYIVGEAREILTKELCEISV